MEHYALVAEHFAVTDGVEDSNLYRVATGSLPLLGVVCLQRSVPTSVAVASSAS